MAQGKHVGSISILTAVSLLLCSAALAAAEAEGPADRRSVEQVMSAVVGIRSEVPPLARSARTLGQQREGSGIVIDGNGLVLTIGYLVLEARHVEVIGPDERVYPARTVGYDTETGLALVRSTSPIPVTPLALGQTGELSRGDPVLVISHGGNDRLSPAMIASRRTFAAYWEYLLDDAIFTAPASEAIAGAALLNRNLELVGVGYLYVSDAIEPGYSQPGNMFVPIDRLRPVLADLLATGRPAKPPRPWLGLNLSEHLGRVIVRRTTRASPAERAGLARGDVLLEIDGAAVGDLEGFYRALWKAGIAGAKIPLKVLQGNRVVNLDITSADRASHYQVADLQ
ncbi:MAG: serine protease [Candidatus Lambdaproteobacteria bacterium]|nr:serine protease [Candidatus Lambdaproteobacteria bacterium]